MVLVRGGDQPEEVWTGSTNLSLGGFSGHVGHWVRDCASSLLLHWELINTDPGAKKATIGRGDEG